MTSVRPNTVSRIISANLPSELLSPRNFSGTTRRSKQQTVPRVSVDHYPIEDRSYDTEADLHIIFFGDIGSSERYGMGL